MLLVLAAAVDEKMTDASKRWTHGCSQGHGHDASTARPWTIRLAISLALSPRNLIMQTC